MDVTCTIIKFVWRPESGMEWKVDATAKPPGVLCQDSCNSGRRSISSQCILTGVQF